MIRIYPLFFMIFISVCAYSSDLLVASDTFLNPGHYNFGTVTVNAGCTLTCKGNSALDTGVVIKCDNLIVNSGGVVSADSQGYPEQQGPGYSNNSAGGAGYGGYGGYYPGYSYGSCYGSIKNPANLGSGGWNAGGGLVSLIVTNELRVDGVISANGMPGAGNYAGGSGGSIYIYTKILSGGVSGKITANGGGSVSRASGGGGRIAVYYETNNFTGAILARRETSAGYVPEASCGTIFMKSQAQTNGELILDGGNYENGLYTPVSGNDAFDTIIVRNLGHSEITSGSRINATVLYSGNANNKIKITGVMILPGSFSYSKLTIINNGEITIPDGNLTLDDSGVLEIMNNNLTLNNLTIKANGVLTHTANYDAQKRYVLNLTVNNNLTIESGGSINVTGKGYPTYTGPGTGTGDCGGSYGGKGGGTSGDTYGSETAPVELGSGGKNGTGGGAMYLLVWGTLNVDGSILADGGSWAGNDGGSGGSIYIKTPNFDGGASGRISVKGGFAGGVGGGGGGRIAIYYYTKNYSGTYDTSPGYSDAGNGTKYLAYMVFHLPPRVPTIDNPAYSSPIPGKRPSFKWTAPTDQENDTLYFEIQVTQDSGFTATPVISAKSNHSQTGFRYSTDNGVVWQDFPSLGVKSDATPAIKVSYAVQQDLWVGNWYWRVCAIDSDGTGNWSDTGYLPSIIGDLIVQINSPEDSIAVYSGSILVEGTIEQSVSSAISINGNSQNLELTDNRFSVTVNLQIGKHEIVVTGNGVLGNYISDTVTVYRLKLPDSSKVERVGKDGGTVRLEDNDGDKENDSRIEIGEGAIEKEVNVTMKSLDGDTPVYGNIPMYEIKVDNRDNYRFKKKVKIVLSYRNLNITADYESRLRIFYWDGIKWQLVGGEINKDKKIVSCYTNHLTKYAVMVVEKSVSEQITVSPQIITPNSDGINDMVVFNVISASGTLEIGIYDENGKIRRILKDEIFGSISVAWEGDDEQGGMLETGVYIYNVNLSGKSVKSGTIVIAK